MRGVIIAGTHSGCGKTTVTLGILAALVRRGLRVQSYKAGPDFIDGGLHSLVTGRPSRNLDLWMCGEEYVRTCYVRHSTDADFSVVEGVMGFYDGSLSTARLSSVLNLPVLLVVDAYGMAESAGAVVHGFQHYGKTVGSGSAKILGVMFNRVGSDRHLARLKAGVHDIPVMGHLPTDVTFAIPHRHLGLTVAEESPLSPAAVTKLAEAIERHVDITGVMMRAEPGAIYSRGVHPTEEHDNSIVAAQTKVRIAVARDRAFCFYYEDNLDLLKDAGAEIVAFSPLDDAALPEDLDGIYFGGGYPELHASRLAENEPMRRAVRSWAEKGNLIYAECGGLMYLSRGIFDTGGSCFEMAGVFPFLTRMKKGRAQLGYREVTLTSDCPIAGRGDSLRGHEFHYSEIIPEPDVGEVSKVYSVRDQLGQTLPAEGYMTRNSLASYMHLHFGSNIEAPKRLVHFMRNLKETKTATSGVEVQKQ